MAIDQGSMQAYAKQWGQLVARAWADPAFKARLLAEPRAALAEQGIAVPPDVEVRAVENTDRVLYLTLPPKPSDELSDEQLDAVAGGDGYSTVACVSSLSCPLGSVASLTSIATF